MYLPISRHDIDDTWLQWLVFACHVHRQRAAPPQDFGQVTGAVGVKVLGNYNGAGKSGGSVATRVERASIPPADEPTTTRCVMGLIFDAMRTLSLVRSLYVDAEYRTL